MSDCLQASPDPRLGEAGDPVGAALRAARRAAGFSLDVLAARTNFSKSYLGNVEAGRRRVTAEIAAAYDTAIGTGGLLGRMLADEPGRLVGREAELAALHRSVVELLAGQGRVVWVEGEPGIGKSALLAVGLALLRVPRRDRANGSYVTLKSPNRKDYSTIIETLDATAPQTLTVTVQGGLSTGAGSTR
jgi:transcriptional regulator with XRE-family HTH domain